MLRKITKDLGRFRVGSQHDYPRGVWAKIAEDAGLKLEKFSEVVEVNPVHQNPLKTRVRIHTRLGGTA